MTDTREIAKRISKDCPSWQTAGAMVEAQSGPAPDFEAEGVRLYCGDCRELLPHIGRVDAVVTDPPYGIGESGTRNRTRNNIALASDYGDDDWDQTPADPWVIQWIQENSDWQIIFGGNFFQLPPVSCWLIWDKENTGNFADAEMAWTNLPGAVRLIRWMWNGMIRKGAEPRFHLTQKPVGVMDWCIEKLPQVSIILDPYCGSGTTGVSCAKRRINFIGIDREMRHLETSFERIKRELAQPYLPAIAPAVHEPTDLPL